MERDEFGRIVPRSGAGDDNIRDIRGEERGGDGRGGEERGREDRREDDRRRGNGRDRGYDRDRGDFMRRDGRSDAGYDRPPARNGGDYRQGEERRGEGRGGEGRRGEERPPLRDDHRFPDRAPGPGDTGGYAGRKRPRDSPPRGDWNRRGQAPDMRGRDVKADIMERWKREAERSPDKRLEPYDSRQRPPERPTDYNKPAAPPPPPASGGRYHAGAPSNFFEARAFERKAKPMPWIWAPSPSPSRDRRSRSRSGSRRGKHRRRSASSSSSSRSDDSRRDRHRKHKKSSKSRKHHKKHKHRRHSRRSASPSSPGSSESVSPSRGTGDVAHIVPQQQPGSAGVAAMDPTPSAVMPEGPALPPADAAAESSSDSEIGPRLSHAPAGVDAAGLRVTHFGSHLRPGEGQAMAHYVEANQRIPRRGEVGWKGDDIAKLENLGYIMSGSRHKRMNEVRIRKENQVLTAAEQKLLEQHNFEEKAAREERIMAEFRAMVAERTGAVPKELES